MKDVKLCLNGCFQLKPRDHFYRSSRSPDGLMSICKSCERERVQIAKHGLTSADKAKIALRQGGCAICGRTEPGAKGWVVDHDRSCCRGDKSCIKCRRGVLCAWCNTALGYAQDSPAILRKMANYLESDYRLPDLNVSLVSSLSHSTDSGNRVVRTERDGGTNEELTDLTRNTYVGKRARETRGI